MRKYVPILSSVAIALVTAVAMGEEAKDVKFDLSDAPPAVQSAIKKAVGTGTLEEVEKETEGGKTVFDAAFKVGAVEHSVKVSEAGAVLEEETSVDAKDLPAAVTKAIEGKYPTGKIEDASLIEADGKRSFEVDVEVGKDDHEIKIDATGKIIEDKIEKDDDQAGGKD